MTRNIWAGRRRPGLALRMERPTTPHLFVLPLLAGAFLLPQAAEARPADCLVVMEGRTYIDGPCEYESYPEGHFMVTLGRRSARVMVDIGFRGGHALYEDTSPDNREARAIGDVHRDGSCWINRVGRVCAWPPGQRPVRPG
jgi:hypothetical protein